MLNKQGDTRQSGHTTVFSILNLSVVPYKVLTFASWPTYRFLRSQVRWSGVSIFIRVFHSVLMIYSVKDSSAVDETEVDVFLVFPCFIYDLADVGNLISHSSAFSEPSLDIWKFLVHIILKAGMQYFKHDLSSKEDESNCLMV